MDLDHNGREDTFFEMWANEQIVNLNNEIVELKNAMKELQTQIDARKQYIIELNNSEDANEEIFLSSKEEGGFVKDEVERLTVILNSEYESYNTKQNKVWSDEQLLSEFKEALKDYQKSVMYAEDRKMVIDRLESAYKVMAQDPEYARQEIIELLIYLKK